MRDKITSVVLMVVTSVWALNFLANLAIPSYEPDPEINSIFLAIVGGVFAVGPAIGGRRGSREEPRRGTEDPPEEPQTSEGRP